MSLLLKYLSIFLFLIFHNRNLDAFQITRTSRGVNVFFKRSNNLQLRDPIIMNAAISPESPEINMVYV